LFPSTEEYKSRTLISYSKNIRSNSIGSFWVSIYSSFTYISVLLIW